MSWKKFAQTHNLTFIPGQFLISGDSVTGQYRGYKLQLSHLEQGVGVLLSLEAELSPRPSKLSQEQANKRVESLKELMHTTAIRRGYVRVMFRGRKLIYSSVTSADLVDNDSTYLQNLTDSVCKLATIYRQLLAVGGQALRILKAKLNGHEKYDDLLRQLAFDIAQQTLDQWQPRDAYLTCLDCMAFATKQMLEIEGLLEPVGLSYIGCRRCHNSRTLFEGPVILTLDQQMFKGQEVVEDTLRVNWLQYRLLFDFHWVEIIQATDEEVERLAVQVGNDTEPFRQPRYQYMNCIISSECELSENTLRILQRMFGKITSR